MPDDAKKARVKKKLKKKKPAKKKPSSAEQARAEGRYNEWVDEQHPGYSVPGPPLNRFK